MGSSGSCEPARLGEIFPTIMVLGARWPVVFIDGNKPEFGKGYWKRCNSRVMQMERSIGRSTLSMARLFEPISMRLGQKGGSKSRGIRQESRWFQHEAAFACRRKGQTDDLCTHCWSASRGHQIGSADGARGRQARGERASQIAAKARLRRQSVQ